MRNDAITLDTNVIEHLFRTEAGGKNADGHVSALITKVITQRRMLCFDVGERMANELVHRLGHYKEHREMGNLQNMLRGLVTLPRVTVDVDHRAGLMLCINKCVPHHTEQSDKVIMFVACMSDTALVSNNNQHITDHGNCLKKCATKFGGTSPEFWDSRTANANL